MCCNPYRNRAHIDVNRLVISYKRLDTRYLATEVAGGFTGVMIGIYTSSSGKPSKAKAYFDWFDYEVKE